MRQRHSGIGLLALVVGMLAVLVSADSPTSPQEQVRELLCSRGFECIQLIEIETGHLVLMVDIGKKSGFFVVDSGATHTIVAREKLAELNLCEPTKIDAEATTVDGKQPVTGSLVLKDLRIGNIIREELKVLVLPLRALHEDIERRYSRPLHGVIGQDFFREYSAVLDFKEGRLYLDPIRAK